MINMLITLCILLIVFGLIFWAIRDFLPVPQPFKNGILCIVILIFCLILLSMIGVIPGGHFGNWNAASLATLRALLV